jgi:hypothetical protein
MDLGRLPLAEAGHCRILNCRKQRIVESAASGPHKIAAWTAGVQPLSSLQRVIVSFSPA